jgi:hypothetical protein
MAFLFFWYFWHHFKTGTGFGTHQQEVWLIGELLFFWGGGHFIFWLMFYTSISQRNKAFFHVY